MSEHNGMNDELTGTLKQAVEQVRAQPVPEGRLVNVQERLEKVQKTQAVRNSRRNDTLAVVCALAASILVGLWFWNPVQEEATEAFVEVGSAIMSGGGHLPRYDEATQSRRPAPEPNRSVPRPSPPGANPPLLPVRPVTGNHPHPTPRPPRTMPAFNPGDIDPGHNTEEYPHYQPNAFMLAGEDPLSTFSIDVDTASYSLVRRFLKQQNQLPPPDAVRIEELVNYFHYDYPQPDGDDPVRIVPEVAACPWNHKHRLVRIGVQARNIDPENLPPRNLVFLIDASGSMRASNKLPLVKKSLGFLIDQLTAKDRVAIVVYAGQAGVVLESTPGNQKEVIRNAVNRLGARGSTNGGQGIIQAYQQAQKGFIDGGVNRVILATDGDFNVGVTSQGGLVRLIEEKRDKGIFLTVLGYGMGNYKDTTVLKLADHGHGHYAYIDSEAEARKVFVEEGMSLITLAKDVKIQVEFNPKQVAGYRLIGYEKRLLKARDFNDDKKHAGVMGCGHSVTALYEIVPAGQDLKVPGIDALKYQKKPKLTEAADSDELLTVKLRYKEPLGDKSRLLSRAVKDNARSYDQASTDFRFAAAVAGFGIILRKDPHAAGINLGGVAELADSAKGLDAHNHRAKFVELAKLAAKLAGKK